MKLEVSQCGKYLILVQDEFKDSEMAVKDKDGNDTYKKSIQVKCQHAFNYEQAFELHEMLLEMIDLIKPKFELEEKEFPISFKGKSPYGWW